MKTYVKGSLAHAVREGLPQKRFELNEKQIKLLKTSAHVVLSLVALAGIVAVAAVAPSIFQVIGKLHRYKSSNREQRQKQISKSFYYLKRKGYIEWNRVGQDLMLKLTNKGKSRLTDLNFQTMLVRHPKKWDGKWWVVLADVPKESRVKEDSLRMKFKQMDFCPFQRSVWIYPYNPRTEVDMIAKFYEIERFVTTMRVDKLEKPDKAALLEFFRKKKVL